MENIDAGQQNERRDGGFCVGLIQWVAILLTEIVVKHDLKLVSSSMSPPAASVSSPSPSMCSMEVTGNFLATSCFILFVAILLAKAVVDVDINMN